MLDEGDQWEGLSRDLLGAETPTQTARAGPWKDCEPSLRHAGYWVDPPLHLDAKQAWGRNGTPRRQGFHLLVQIVLVIDRHGLSLTSHGHSRTVHTTERDTPSMRLLNYTLVCGGLRLRSGLAARPSEADPLAIHPAEPGRNGALAQGVGEPILRDRSNTELLDRQIRSASRLNGTPLAELSKTLMKISQF
jgi:hypothetical protein